MTKGTQRFLSALRALGRTRVERAALMQILNEVFPGEAQGPDAHHLLRTQLEVLAEAQWIGLPKTRAGWDHTSRPALPEWIRVTHEAAPTFSRPDHRTVPWAPELAFVADLPRVEDFEVLQRIQRFFAEGGRSKPLVPLRERSVTLFLDEKRLEKLERTALFGPGRLTLEMLRCFPVASPLVWEVGPEEARGHPLLVIENHHTWDSFRRWNQVQGDYAGVVYGAGNAFASSAEFLLQVLAETGAQEVHYFGDLDLEGLKIVQRAQQRLRDSGGVNPPVIRPAERWYVTLLQRGRAVLGEALDHDAGAKGKVPTSPVPKATVLLAVEPGPEDDPVVWLPPGIRAEVRALFARGKRLPQELVGWEVLVEGLG